MVYCYICNRECKNIKSLTQHILQTHNIQPKDYYDIYLKKYNEDICNHENCNNKTNFYNIRLGYSNYCSLKCANTSTIRRKQEKERVTKKYKDPNERLKTSIYVKNVFKNPKLRKKVSDGVLKAHKNDPTIKDKISIGIKKAYDDNSELRKKASDHAKKLWSDKDIRKKMLKSQRKTWLSEEYRKKET